MEKLEKDHRERKEGGGKDGACGSVSCEARV